MCTCRYQQPKFALHRLRGKGHVRTSVAATICGCVSNERGEEYASQLVVRIRFGLCGEVHVKTGCVIIVSLTIDASQ